VKDSGFLGWNPRCGKQLTRGEGAFCEKDSFEGNRKRLAEDS
jgi:hypothetical protein